MKMKMIVRTVFFIVFFGMLSQLGLHSRVSLQPRVYAAAQEDLPPEVVAFPDIVLFGGKILTVDSAFSTAQAIAIRDDRILAVGDNARILKMVGPKTQKIDLKGRTVVPGFIDTHHHLGDYSVRYMLLEEKGIRWEGKVEMLGILWKDMEMAFRDIKRAVEVAGPGELVRIPTRNGDVLKTLTMVRLDSVSPQNAVIVVSAAQLRPVALNTKAREWLKLPPEMPGLPKDGGVMIGADVVRLASDTIARNESMERLMVWHKKAMKLDNSWGLTVVTTRITPDQFNALREVWLQDGLTVRWRLAFPGPLNFPATGNMSDIGDDWLRISGASAGALPGLGATLGHWSTHQPLAKLEDLPDEEGGSIARWPESRRSLLDALRYGWSTPNTHVKGNIAVREFLNVIEEAQRDPVVKSSNQRFSMAHMEEVDDEDVARMKRLGVMPSNMMRDLFNDGHQGGSSAYQAVFGADYVDKMLPIKKYIDQGVRPTLESDSGDEATARPLWTIGKAVCRCVDGSTRIWGRDQKITRQDALKMKTIWAAASVGDARKLGSLEPGKLADVAVLDGDYMSVPEEKIADLKVVLTIVGGRVVYSADASVKEGR